MKTLIWIAVLYLGYKLWKDKRVTLSTPAVDGQGASVSFQLYSGLANGGDAVTPDPAIVVQSWPGGYTQ